LNESRGLKKHTLNLFFAETALRAYIHRMRSLFANLGALMLIAAVFFIVLSHAPQVPPTSGMPPTVATTSAQTATVAIPAQVSSSSAPVAHATSTPAKKRPAVATSTPAEVRAPQQAPANTISRIQNPYPFAPIPTDQLNVNVRTALVNILCMPRGGSLSPVSGSGVLIDPRGVILTNAHVAQYVLLSEDPRVNLSCTVRTGAPATARWVPSVLYIPPVWVDEHASEILTAHPSGTGEHDYALLLITGTVDGTPVPTDFPYLPVDTRSAVAFPTDNVLVASYPAEFLGGIAAEYNLYPASSVASVGQFYTFTTASPDVLALGGVIEAQSGSSGGAVVNAWGRLVGLIVTTSEGTTTSQRDLHALALSYIERDLKAQTGIGLAGTLDGNVYGALQIFTADSTPDLTNLFLKQLEQQL